MYKRLAAIALLSVSLAAAKSYNFTLAKPSQAGSTTLKPGRYVVKVDGTKAALFDGSGHPIDSSAKLADADRKYEQTSVDTESAGGSDKIRAIKLAGSKSQVVFE